MKTFFYMCSTLLLLIPNVRANTKANVVRLPISSKVSLMRIGVDPLPVTENGKKTAEMLWQAIDKNDTGKAEKVIKKYEKLLEKESKTGDYGALKWLAECFVASDEKKRSLITNPLSADFYQFFADSGYKKLKDYLQRKYKVNDFTPEDPERHLRQRTFLEDMIMFNNPRRNDWENSMGIVRHIGLQPGDKVADIGCGFGFYSYLFSTEIGPGGKVYAVDTSEPYIQYLKRFVEKHQITNIQPIVSSTSDIMVEDTLDVAFMCSVYHIIYGWSREIDRAAFINSIKKALRKDGLLVIADNSFMNGQELNNCYLNYELAIVQLGYYGFQFQEYVQITPQRYLLIFKHLPDKNCVPVIENHTDEEPPFYLNINSGKSVIHIGSLDSYDITERGTAAAKEVLNALENKDMVAARKAVQFYNELIPEENFGGEYSALQWFCELMISPKQLQNDMLRDPLIQAYYDYLANDDYRLLREYIKYKYKLGKEEKKEEETRTMTEEDREIGRTRRAFLEDFILFNNPKREDWEKTSKIMAGIDLKSGQKVIDIGSGSGYYSYRFSKIVGDRGKVYAVDIKEGHLDFLKEFTNKQKIKNIKTVLSKTDDICVKDKADYLFMCSLYHIIYGVFSEPDRSGFIESMKRAMKKDGRLIVVDNGPVASTLLPYHGPYITRDLIIDQLAFYGFVLEKQEQIIPQRYMLTFILDRAE